MWVWVCYYVRGEWHTFEVEAESAHSLLPSQRQGDQHETWKKSQSLTISMYNVYRPYGTIRNKICIARIFPFSPGTPWLSWTKFLSLKFWRRNLDYAKNLQEKYFTGENIIIIFQYFNTGVPYVQFRNSSEGWWGSNLKSRKSL